MTRGAKPASASVSRTWRSVYRRALLQALQALERQRREGRRIGLELAELIGLGPGAQYRLALPLDRLPPPRRPVLDIAALETLALRQRPELREAQLSGRIAAAEARKALLRVLPGIELSAGAHTEREAKKHETPEEQESQAHKRSRGQSISM